MSISTSISRLAFYYRRNGFRATVRRFTLAVSRVLFYNRMVVYYCDLSELRSLPADLPSSVTVERKQSETELDPRDLENIVNFSNPEQARRNIKERFEQGASLWLIKSEGGLAGFRWSLGGRTLKRYFFPLGQDDVHVFDGFVFPQYRGRGLSPLLFIHILHSLAAESGSRGRAFGEVAEWNQAQLSSLRKTPFRRMGWARKFTIFRRTIVCWDENETAKQKDQLKALSMAAVGGKRSDSSR